MKQSQRELLASFLSKHPQGTSRDFANYCRVINEINEL